MGSCVSRSPAPAAVQFGQTVAIAKVMDFDGSMAQFAAPVTAHEALGDERRRASCLVCSSEPPTSSASTRPSAQWRQRRLSRQGSSNFVLPLSFLRRPLSGQDMAALAVKAASALGAGVSSLRKAAGKQSNTGRVAPGVVVSSNQGERDGQWNYHVYGKYEPSKTVCHRARVQRLSDILEANE